MKCGGSCKVGSAASTEHVLGPGTFVGPRGIAKTGKKIWNLRKVEIKGSVKDWSMRELTELNDEQALQSLSECENILSTELKRT